MSFWVSLSAVIFGALVALPGLIHAAVAEVTCEIECLETEESAGRLEAEYFEIDIEREKQPITVREIKNRLQLTERGTEIFDQHVFFCNAKHSLNVSLCNNYYLSYWGDFQADDWKYKVTGGGGDLAVVAIPDILFELDNPNSWKDFIDRGGRQYYLEEIVFITVHEFMHIVDRLLGVVNPWVWDCGEQALESPIVVVISDQYLDCIDDHPEYSDVITELGNLFANPPADTEFSTSAFTGFEDTYIIKEYRRVFNIANRWNAPWRKPLTPGWSSEFYVVAGTEVEQIPQILENHYSLIFKNRWAVVKIVNSRRYSQQAEISEIDGKLYRAYFGGFVPDEQPSYYQGEAEVLRPVIFKIYKTESEQTTTTPTYTPQQTAETGVDETSQPEQTNPTLLEDPDDEQTGDTANNNAVREMVAKEDPTGESDSDEPTGNIKEIKSSWWNIQRIAGAVLIFIALLSATYLFRAKKKLR